MDINYPVAAAAYVYRNAGSTSNPAQLPKIEEMLRENSDMALSVSRTPEYQYFLSAGIGSMEGVNKKPRASMDDVIKKSMGDDDAPKKARPAANQEPPRPRTEDVPKDESRSGDGSTGDKTSSADQAVSDSAESTDDLTTLSRLIAGASTLASKRPSTAGAARSAVRNAPGGQASDAPQVSPPRRGEPATAELIPDEAAADDLTSLDALQSPDDLARVGSGPRLVEGPSEKPAITEQRKLEDQRPTQEGTASRSTRPTAEVKTDKYTIKTNQDGTAELTMYDSGRTIDLDGVMYKGKQYYYHGSFVFDSKTGQLVSDKNLAKAVLDFVDR